jgi:5-methylcytosine-specific restriction endonuclease McrA
VAYDWQAIQAYHDAGNNITACMAKFGFARKSWYTSIEKGRLIPRDHRIPLEQLLTENSKHARGHVKRRLLADGLIKNECSECGQGDTWNGKPLVMVMDHRNGVNNDHRIGNLRMLCPNCNSQTETFAGRNVRL